MAGAVAAGAALILLLDFSGSMEQKVGGRTKVSVLRENAAAIVEKLPANANVSTLYYGSVQGGGCTDIKQVLVPREGFRAWISHVHPAPFSKTPLAQAVASLKKTMASLDPGSVRRAMIITDGNDTCGGDFCAQLKELDRTLGESSSLLRLAFIGYDLNAEDKKALDCGDVGALKHVDLEKRFVAKPADFQSAVEQLDRKQVKKMPPVAKKAASDEDANVAESDDSPGKKLVSLSAAGVMGLLVQPKGGDGKPLTVRVPGKASLTPGEYTAELNYPSWLKGKVKISFTIKAGEKAIDIGSALEGKIDWIDPPADDASGKSEHYLDLSSLGVEDSILVLPGVKIPVPAGTPVKWIE